jgi:hypothetical protein
MAQDLRVDQRFRLFGYTHDGWLRRQSAEEDRINRMDPFLAVDPKQKGPKVIGNLYVTSSFHPIETTVPRRSKKRARMGAGGNREA